MRSKLLSRDSEIRKSQILEFITNFRTNRGKYNKVLEEVIRSHFKNGYCWHFAHMLKSTFECGEICWAAPLGHIVWCDTFTDSYTYYDIEGIYEKDKTDCIYLIPEKYLMSHMSVEYSHVVPDDKLPRISTMFELITVMKYYCEDNNIPYDESIEEDISFGKYKLEECITILNDLIPKEDPFAGLPLIELVDHESCLE